MRPTPAPPAELDLYAVLNALADPIRLTIVASLAATDTIECGGFDVPVTKSTLTHHFRVLRESGVIATERVGTRSLNRLRRTELETRFPGVLESVLRNSPPPLRLPAPPGSGGQPRQPQAPASRRRARSALVNGAHP